MKNKQANFLSKSKYIDGLQCSKLLWYEYNRKEDIPSFSAATQAVMDQGKIVGEFAQKLFPGGVPVERDLDPNRQHQKSIKALELRKPLFEAGFLYERSYAIADILVPAPRDTWDLYEVKSSTSVKSEHVYDLAFQKYVYESAGVPIGKCFLIHIDNQYVRKGEIDPKKLFAIKDFTEQADSLKGETASKIKDMLNVIEQSAEPDIKIGTYCDDPYECRLKEKCWQFLPKRDHVFILSRGKKLAFALIEQGIHDVLNLPAGTKLTDKQTIQVNSHKSGQPYIDKQALRDFLVKLEYPLHFLDFETIWPAIPAYDLSRPYEQVPFQYSLYVANSEKDDPKHFSYIAPDKNDPRKEILKRLKNLLGDKGSAVAYNAPFEINAIQAAAEVYPEYKAWATDIKKRFVDLLEPFRSFYYYTPAQEGSNSIKQVLPAVTQSGYKGMEIADGGQASSEYYRVTFNEGISENERNKVCAALDKYCNLDTQGMIDILRFLRKAVE